MESHIFKTLLNLTERGLSGTKEFYILFQKGYVNCDTFFFGLNTGKTTPLIVYDHKGVRWDMRLFHTDNEEFRIPSLKPFFETYHVEPGDIIVFEAHEINGVYSFNISHEKCPYDNVLLFSARRKAMTVIKQTIPSFISGNFYTVIKGQKVPLSFTSINNGYSVMTSLLDSNNNRIPLNVALKPFEYYSIDSSSGELKPIHKINVKTIKR